MQRTGIPIRSTDDASGRILPLLTISDVERIDDPDLDSDDITPPEYVSRSSYITDVVTEGDDSLSGYVLGVIPPRSISYYASAHNLRYFGLDNLRSPSFPSPGDQNLFGSLEEGIKSGNALYGSGSIKED
jgi:hypothetical protein